MQTSTTEQTNSIPIKNTATYEVCKTTAYISCVFKDNAETLDKILERLIKNDS